MLPARTDELPGFRRASQVIRPAVMALRPPRRVLVSEVAEECRILRNPGGGYSGPWRNALAPYLVDIMDDFVRPGVEEVDAILPTQSGKSEVILNLVLYQAKEGGADTLITQPSRELALDFSERRVDKIFSVSEDLSALLGDERGDDKRLSKLFRSGARCTMGWPVSGQVSGRPIPWVLIDERDSCPDDIGGEGDLVELGRQRTSTFGRHARVGVFSTVKRQDGSGIVARWRGGDRRLWYWPCPHCGEHFSPGFDDRRRPTLAHFFCREDATEEEARAEAALVCPNPDCGRLILETHRAAMNARGVWLPEGVRITRDGEIIGTPRRSTRRSYWLTGFAVRTKSWAGMAAQLVLARRALAERQSEAELTTWWNADFGAPYRSVRAGAEALEPEALKRRAEALDLKVVPGWAGFVTTAVDVQGNRFDCMAVAHGPGGRSQVIEAWQEFKTVDATTGEERMLDPPRRGEDWDLLNARVLKRTWRGAAGAEFNARLNVVDTGGSDGVTGHAYDWWIRLRTEDPALAQRVQLLRGDPRAAAPIFSIRKMERDGRGRPLKRGVDLAFVNTLVLKDQMDLKLRMEAPGPGWIHLPKDLPQRFWEEATAEVRSASGEWTKQRQRNEAWDLLVYNLFAWYRLGGPRIDWSNPPEWARPRAGSLFAAVPEEIARTKEDTPAAPAPRRSTWLRPGGGGGSWLGRR